MPEPSAAYVDALHLAATADAVPSEANKLDGINEATVSFSADQVDTNYFGSDGFKRRKKTLKDFTIPLSGHLHKGSAPHVLLRTSFMTDTVVYLLVIEDETATEGSRGWRYPVTVDSYEEGKSVADLITLSVTLNGAGAPVAY
ncbi:phage tail tube protein [Myxococcus sp. AB036A]|uniref:phage tail tube protein n=1 Tax=Myxococcus sp. AB036A TaxID=2562793 RepID=UPI0011465F49|nr:phage tail tube protein [Myxococcus sp. AB036A]